MQYAAAVLSLAVMYVFVSGVQHGDRANGSASFHRHALLMLQLSMRKQIAIRRFAQPTQQLRQRAAPRANDRRLAGLERAEKIVDAVVDSVRVMDETQPVQLFGVRLGKYLLSSAMLGFLSTAAIVVRVLTHAPSR